MLCEGQNPLCLCITGHSSHFSPGASPGGFAVGKGWDGPGTYQGEQSSRVAKALALESARPLSCELLHPSKPQFLYVQNGNSPQQEVLGLEPAHGKAPTDVVCLHLSDLWPLSSQDHASRCCSGQRGQGGLVPGGDTGSESQTTTRKPTAGVQTLCREVTGAQGEGGVREVGLAPGHWRGLGRVCK